MMKRDRKKTLSESMKMGMMEPKKIQDDDDDRDKCDTFDPWIRGQEWCNSLDPQEIHNEGDERAR